MIINWEIFEFEVSQPKDALSYVESQQLADNQVLESNKNSNEEEAKSEILKSDPHSDHTDSSNSK